MRGGAEPLQGADSPAVAMPPSSALLCKQSVGLCLKQQSSSRCNPCAFHGTCCVRACSSCHNHDTDGAAVGAVSGTCITCSRGCHCICTSPGRTPGSCCWLPRSLHHPAQQGQACHGHLSSVQLCWRHSWRAQLLAAPACRHQWRMLLALLQGHHAWNH